MSVQLAADGGQTALRMALVVDGSVSEIASAGGFAYRGGLEPTGIMADRVAEAYQALGSPAGVEQVCLGQTGVPGDSVRRRRLAAAISERLGGPDVWLGADVVTSHAGALAGAAGVVIAAGTGVTCLGVADDGDAHQADGHGYLLGDAGSGFAIGRAALRAVMAARDGRGPHTALVDAAAEAFGGLDQLGHRLYGSTALVATVAGCTPWVAAVARAGDPVAATIWRDAVDALVHTTLTVVQRTFSDAESASVPVSYAGGLFGIEDLLRRPYLAALVDRLPAAQPHPPKGGSLEGAVHLLTHGLGRHRPLMYTFKGE